MDDESSSIIPEYRFYGTEMFTGNQNPNGVPRWLNFTATLEWAGPVPDTEARNSTNSRNRRDSLQHSRSLTTIQISKELFRVVRNHRLEPRQRARLRFNPTQRIPEPTSICTRCSFPSPCSCTSAQVSTHFSSWFKGTNRLRIKLRPSSLFPDAASLNSFSPHHFLSNPRNQIISPTRWKT